MEKLFWIVQMSPMSSRGPLWGGGRYVKVREDVMTKRRLEWCGHKPSQEIQAASVNCKGQGNGFSLTPPKGMHPISVSGTEVKTIKFESYFWAFVAASFYGHKWLSKFPKIKKQLEYLRSIIYPACIHSAQCFAHNSQWISICWMNKYISYMWNVYRKSVMNSIHHFILLDSQ